MFEFINAIKIVQDTNCTRETRTPIKIHTKKKNKNYHKRIQKKWIKRYGMKIEYTAYKVNTGSGYTIICHPKIYQELKNNMNIIC